MALNQLQEYHESHTVGIFFTLVIIFPVFAILLGWLSMYGAFPYIRSHINNDEVFPSIAALYWIGQTVTIFVIVMDIATLSEGSKIHSFQNYQLVFVGLVIVVEILSMILSFLLLLVSLASHLQNTSCKSIFEHLFRFVCCRTLSFKQIGRKEARVWLILGSLIAPILALASHASFIIGGWVSYTERSIAVLLLYLFIFVFLYWSLQYIYMFLIFIINYLVRERKSKTNETSCKDDSKAVHFEVGITRNSQGIKKIGFDTPALFFMFFIVIFLYVTLAYVGYGLLITLIFTFDDALVHIYNLGQYGIVVTVFLLTYKLFTIKDAGNQTLISNDALRYWRFLNTKPHQDCVIADLYSAIKCLRLTLKAFDENDREWFTEQLKKREFDLKIVTDYLKKAIKTDSKPHPVKLRSKSDPVKLKSKSDPIKSRSTSEPHPVSGPHPDFKSATEIFRTATDCGTVNLVEFERKINDFEGKIGKVRECKLSTADRQAAIKLTFGINQFRKILLSILDLPTMYLNRDKASALTAAFVYHKIHTFDAESHIPHGSGNYPQLPRPEDNQRYALLLSLIEEDF